MGFYFVLNFSIIKLMLPLIKKEIRSIDGPRGPWLLIVACLILLAAAVSFFGGKSVTNNNVDFSARPISSLDIKSPRIYTVSYKAGVFSPTNLRIHAGDTVRFKNESFFPVRIASDPHPSHSDMPGFDSIGDIPQNSYFSFTFSEKGIFGYHNNKNVDEGGTIIVR